MKKSLKKNLAFIITVIVLVIMLVAEHHISNTKATYAAIDSASYRYDADGAFLVIERVSDTQGYGCLYVGTRRIAQFPIDDMSAFLWDDIEAHGYSMPMVMIGEMDKSNWWKE